MKLSTIGLTTAAVALLGVLAAPAVHAAEVPGEAKDSKTQVTIIDSPDPVGVLKLVAVPTQYDFQTKLLPGGEYTVSGSVDKDSDNNISVFNDKSTQDWSVKASIDNNILKTDKDHTATVTQFKINGTELMGNKTTGIVAKAAADKTVDNNTGQMDTPVKDDGLSISFNDEHHSLKAEDVLKGTVHYQLFNTPDAK